MVVAVHAAPDKLALHAYGGEIPLQRCADHEAMALRIFPVQDTVPEGAHQAFEGGAGGAPMKRLVDLDGVVGLLLSLQFHIDQGRTPDPDTPQRMAVLIIPRQIDQATLDQRRLFKTVHLQLFEQETIVQAGLDQ